MTERQRPLRFDRFEVDLRTGELRSDGRKVRLQERPFQVLAALLDRPGDLVTRDELRLQLWPANTFVDFDNGLNTAVAKLRQALGDTADRPRFIETLQGRGYRFIGGLEPPVQPRDDVSRAGARPASARVSATTDHASSATPPVTGSLTTHRGVTPARSWRLVVVTAAAATIVVSIVIWRWREPHVVAQHSLVFASEASNRAPSLSPDGSLVAFISTASGTPQLWTKSVANGEPVQVTSGEIAAASPTWSPRGDQIFFDRVGDGIWSVGPLGSPAPRRLIPSGRNASLSADGRRLVFEREREIWMADAQGANPRRLYAAPQPWTSEVPMEPALSPDGRTIAYFLAESGPNGDFWLVPADGGQPRRLTADVCEGGRPAWAPDGRAVIVWSARAGSPNIWRLPIDGGSPLPLTSGAGEDRAPAVSSDGRTVVYTTVRNTWALRVIDALTGSDRELISRRSPIWLPQYSPDGERLAFFHRAGREIHVFTVREDGSDLRQVTHGRGEWNIHPTWSPDGRYLYFYRERPEPAFRRIAADGGSPEDVMPGWRWQTHMHAQVDPTGQRVAYSLQGGGTEETTVLRDLSTGRETPLPPPHLHNLQWTPDGLLIGHRHDDTIVACAPDGSPCDVVTTGLRPALAADGSVLYVQRPTGDRSRVELWRVGMDGRGAHKIRDVGPLAPLSYSMSASRHQRIAWTEYRAGRHELWQLRLASPL